MKIGRKLSPWMIIMVVGLFWKNAKPASVSFEEFSFWTETIDRYLMDLQNSNVSDLLELRVWLEGL